jgi:hypothetical protein
MIKAMIVVIPTVATIEPQKPPERFRLTCAGMLRGADATIPPSPIQADGTVDLAQMRVYGFGVGGAAILRVSDREIGFGPKRDRDAGAGNFVEGTFGRTTGTVDIAVRSVKGTGNILSIHLDCRTVGPTS